MRAQVMNYFDTARQEYRALVDVIDADGERHPAGAARGADKTACARWITAILQDYGFSDNAMADVQILDLPEMARPSFVQVRTRAAFLEAQGA